VLEDGAYPWAGVVGGGIDGAQFDGGHTVERLGFHRVQSQVRSHGFAQRLREDDLGQPPGELAVFGASR
jgi:hypothetical protein